MAKHDKRILNIKDPKKAVEYANLFISRIPKGASRILVYGIADIRTLEEILIAFPDKEFTIVEQVNIINLLKCIYTENKYHFVEAEYDSADLALFNENGEIGKMPRFDCCIMNPPYEGSLHLQFVKEILKHAERVVNISPIRWLQDPLARLKKDSDYLKFEETVSKRICSLDTIPSEVSNAMFGISCGDLGIYTLTEQGGFDYSFAQHDPFVEKLVSKCKKGSFSEHATRGGYRGEYKSEHFGIINSYYGAIKWVSDDFELFTTKRETYTNMVLFFDSDDEVRNCFDYLTSRIMKFFASIVRINQCVPWRFVPWLDFTRPWTDKDLCEFFGITGYISDTEAEPGSEWETILKKTL